MVAWSPSPVAATCATSGPRGGGAVRKLFPGRTAAALATLGRKGHDVTKGRSLFFERQAAAKLFGKGLGMALKS